MSAMQRRKGQVGEREAAALIRTHTGWDVRRRVRQHDGDSDLEGIPGWSVEVKNAADLRIPEWWRQCVDQSVRVNAVPLLVYRVPRRGWLFRWPVATLLRLQTGEMWHGLEWSVESTVEAWAAVARDLLPTPPAPFIDTHS
jgi:hypothetical protein